MSGGPPEWPKTEPDAETMIRYAVGRGAWLNGLAWGYIEAGAFDGDEGDPVRLRYLASTVQMIHLHDVAMALKALRALDADVADGVARNMWRSADAGDGYGEWLWEWAAEAGLDGDALYEAGKAAARENDSGAGRTTSDYVTKRFVVEVSVRADADPSAVADDLLDLFCSTDGNAVVMSFDSVEPMDDNDREAQDG